MSIQANRKGLLIAGGEGKRLFPSTICTSKQLIPVYDKPLIYYPLTTLMLCGIRDILIVTTPSTNSLFNKLLGNGSKWGINLNYAIQLKPEGISQAILSGEDFIGRSNTVVALGDNIFHSNMFSSLLSSADMRTEGATVFSCRVSDPKRYGIVQFDNNGNVLSIDEKPQYPKSNYAITGLYFYDNSVFERIKKLDFSSRNELEITSLNNSYLMDGLLHVESLGRGITWFDVGTNDSLLQASDYMRTVQLRQGLKIGCPEEIAWRQGWIDSKKLCSLAEETMESGYGKYLLQILNN